MPNGEGEQRPYKFDEPPRRSAIDIFKEVSGAGPEVDQAFEELNATIGELPDDLWDAAVAIRQVLIRNGYHYDNNTFRAQDVLGNKQGNCLGLTCLIGAILEYRGRTPDYYESILNPEEQYFNEESRFFEAYDSGGKIDYDNPDLPEGHVDEIERRLRFFPLEHATLMLGGKRFEVTSLEGDEVEPLDVNVERITPGDYAKLASQVFVDRARVELEKEQTDFKEVQRLIDKAIQRWPENREVYELAESVASSYFDDERVRKMQEQYQALDGDDSRYHFNMWDFTGDPAHLDAALERYPAFMAAYVQKNVVQAKDPRDARKALAVAAHCIARSISIDLGDFYVSHGRRIAQLWDPEEAVELLRVFEREQQGKATYHLALFDLTKDQDYLKPLLEHQDRFQTPADELVFCYVTKDELPESARRFEELVAQYGTRSTFQEALKHLEEQWGKR